LGAVNLVIFGEDGAVGHNTDWSGFRSALSSSIGSIEGETVAQLGAGGAGAATAYALLSLGVSELTIVDRDLDRAQSLAARYRDAFSDARITAATLDELDGLLTTVQGIVHATPTGMHLSPGLPFDPELL